MAKIKYLNFLNVFQLKRLVSHISTEKVFSYNTILLSFPLTIINNFLPLKLKFKDDSFVAEQKGDLKAVLTIKSRKHNPYKWRIKRLLLEENAYEIGEQLIDYVVAKYGASGAETIEVKIKNDDSAMIDLFSKSCGFRYCLDYQIFKLNKNEFTSKFFDLPDCLFRPYKSSDKQNLADLYNQNILPYYKFPLSRSKEEFNESVFRGLYKTSLFKYILEDKYSKQIRGYVQIETVDNHNFVLEIVLLQSFENYYECAILFALSQIKKRTNNYHIYIRNNRFHCNSNDFETVLKNKKSEIVRTDMIFVKDFFRQIKDENPIIKPAIIYNEIKGKPAFKS